MALRGTIDLTSATNAYMFEPQRTNHFEVTFNKFLTDANHSLAVSTFSLPNVTTDPIEVPHGNSRIKFAGQAAFGGSDTLEVIDYIGLDMEGAINTWKNAVYNAQTDKMGLASDYKATATVTEYSPDGVKMSVWTLEGVWPSGVAFGDTLSNDGSDIKKITMTLAYDRGYRDDTKTTRVTAAQT